MPPKQSKTHSPLPPITRPSRRAEVVSSVVTDASPELSGDCEQILQYVIFTFQTKFDEFRNELLSEIKKKDDKIEMLEQRVSSLDREVNSLKNQLDISENYNRQDEFVVSGDVVQAAATHSDNPKDVLCHILKSNLKYELPIDKLLSVRYIGTGSGAQISTKKKMFVKVTNSSLKQDIIRSCKLTRPANLFINDNLTPSRSKILFLPQTNETKES